MKTPEELLKYLVDDVTADIKARARQEGFEAGLIEARSARDLKQAAEGAQPEENQKDGCR